MWKKNREHLCIAISGLSGCGNTTVSKSLSQILDIEFINYTLRNLAQDHNIPFDEMRKLVEQDDKWDRFVDENQVTLSQQSSCVIGSRLAIWMIPSANIKVYLEAQEEVRVQRIHKREGGNVDIVRSKTHERDLADYNRYMKLYQIDIRNYREQADILIDVNNIGVEEVVHKILVALEERTLIIQS